MFNWLRNHFERRRRAKARQTFCYWTGNAFAAADPHVILRAIRHDATCNFEAALPLADQNQEPEITQVVEATCRIFGTRRWDGRSGLTDREILQLLDSFFRYLDDLKKNISPGATLPPSMGLGPSPVPADQSQTTNASSDSGSTSSGPKCDDPAPSAMA